MSSDEKNADSGRVHADVRPVGPSSDDYYAWLEGRPDLKARFQPYPGFTERIGYEIWRNAWLACEREHGIRMA